MSSRAQSDYMYHTHHFLSQGNNCELALENFEKEVVQILFGILPVLLTAVTYFQATYLCALQNSRQNMSFSAASKCPFLTRVPSTFLRNCGSSIGMYGQRCPVMSKLFHTAVGAARQGANRKPITLGKHALGL